MSRRIPVCQVDAFSAHPFAGNPAAVVLLDKDSLPMDDHTRQNIAAEMNLAETAFLEPLDAASSGDSFSAAAEFKLRWFTPTTEVPLCGHATLASAAVLFQVYSNPHSQLSFHTRSGPLTVSKAVPVTASGSASKNALFLEMRLPLADPVDAVPTGLDDLSGPLAHLCTGDLPVHEVRYAAKDHLNYLLLVLGGSVTREQLEEIKPEASALLASASRQDIHGVIVSAHGGDSGYDFLSRFFAPWMGIEEDPVTGSAHAVLGPFWSKRLNRQVMTARQCSKRGGDLTVRVDPEASAVWVSGQATLVLQGHLLL